MASVGRILRRGLTVAALKAQAERDFSLELRPCAFEQRQKSARLDSSSGLGLSRGEVARRPAQFGTQRGVERERTGVCGRDSWIRLGTERFETLAGIEQRTPHVIDRRHRCRAACFRRLAASR